MIGSEPDEEYDEEPVPPRRLPTPGRPALAIAGLVLATVSLLGTPVANTIGFLLYSGGGPTRSAILQSAVQGGLAIVAGLLGRSATRGVDEAHWVRAAGAAAIVLAVISVVLYAIAAIVVAVHGDNAPGLVG